MAETGLILPQTSDRRLPLTVKLFLFSVRAHAWRACGTGPVRATGVETPVADRVTMR